MPTCPDATRPRRPLLAAALLAALALLACPRPAVTAEATPRTDDAGEERKQTGDEPGERYEQEFFKRIGGGEITSQRYRHMAQAARAMPTEVTGTQATNTWALAGPIFSTNPGGGFMTGRVRDIDPINIRALAATGGLWRFSIFTGIPMCDSLPASWFGSFATRPTDANTILIGTGEYRFGQGTGLYKTTDGGATWEWKPMSPAQPWYSKVRWSSDGAVAYAAGDSGLFRSTDGGETWTRRLNAPVSDFCSVAGVTGLMYATVVSTGVFKSTDGGVTWTQIIGGGVPSGIAGIGAVTAVNFPSGGGVYMYVAFDARIWRSLNGGVSWTEVTPGNFTIGNSGYGPAISANPTDPQTVLYGNVGYCRSLDAGGSWTKITSPHLHADYHRFEWEANTNNVWAAHDGGWSKSTDRGLNWSSSTNAMPISQFYTIAADHGQLSYMIGGTQDNNVLYTPNTSLNWIEPQVGSSEGDAFGTAIDLYNPQTMWAVAGVYGGAIAFPRHRTTDGGTTWGIVDNGIGASSVWGGSIRSDNVFNPRLVTSIGPSVYESTDGVNWTLQRNFSTNVQSLTSSIRVSPSANLYVTTANTASGDRLWVRDHDVWVERDAGLPANRRILKVVPHPWFAYADEAWAIVQDAAAIWHTTNRGVTWTNVTGDLPSIGASDLVVNPRRDGEWYVGTLFGVVRTKDGGVHWEHWNNGMPPYAMVTEMEYIDLTASGGAVYVVAATYGRSVWKRDVSGEDVFPTIEVSGPSVQEGDAGTTTAWFRLRIPSQATVTTVDYSTGDATATVADNDYVPASGTVTWAAGETDKWISVQVNGDTRIEPSEGFNLVLSNPLRAQIGFTSGCVIQDDDFHDLMCKDRYVTDGAVNAIAISGNGVYIGGSFNKVGPATGSGVPLSATTGQALSLPMVDGSVNVVVPDGAGGWYLGGDFAHVGGMPRQNLARIFADGSLSPWNPNASGEVSALAVSGNLVYAGGIFNAINGAYVHYLAAIDATTGLPTSWAPEPNAPVLSLALNGTTLYVGGSFTTIGGKARNRIAAVSTATGLALNSFNANANGDVGALVYDGAGLLYACGSFTSIGGQTRRYLASLYQTGDATPWNPNPNLNVFAIALGSGVLYAGGAFDSIGGQARPALAALDLATGNASSTWTPQCDGNVNAFALNGGTLYVGGTFSVIGGQSRTNLAALSTTNGNATSWNPAPNATVLGIVASGSTVFAGGYFTTLAPQPRANLAGFDLNTGALLPWNPGANGTVNALVADNGLLYVGGAFTTLGGQLRNRIAAIDPNLFTPTAWDPNASSNVNALLVSGATVYVGGNFTSIGGQTRNRIAALSTSTGLATSFDPNANSVVYCLATDGNLIYAGGGFTNIGGQNRNFLAVLAPTSGAASPTWNPNPNGAVRLLVYVAGGGLYVGGAFTTFTGINRARLVALDLNTNTVVWTPSPNDEPRALVPYGSNVYVGGRFSIIGGRSRPNLAKLRPSTNQLADWYPLADDDVYALALNGATLYVGGSFRSIGGMPQRGFACLIPSENLDVPLPRLAAQLAARLSPNPATGPVRIAYDLPRAAHVSIGIYDVQGRRIGPAIESDQPAGTHEAKWEPAAREAPAGIYFVRVKAGPLSMVKRLVRL